MTSLVRPHSYIIAASATTGTSIDELIRPGLQQAFPLPSKDDPQEDRFRGLLDALAQRFSSPRPQSARGHV